jgi:predicted Zn-dependent protease
MQQILAHTLAAIRRRDWDAAATARDGGDGRQRAPRPAVPMMDATRRLCRRSGRPDAAAALADRVVAAAPAEPAAYLARSHLAQHRGDLAQAIADTRAAMACSADPGPARPRLADLLYEAGDLEAAAALLQAILGPEGDDPVLLARLADVADEAGDGPTMTAALDRAMAARRRTEVGWPAC